MVHDKQSLKRSHRSCQSRRQGGSSRKRENERRKARFNNEGSPRDDDIPTSPVQPNTRRAAVQCALVRSQIELNCFVPVSLPPPLVTSVSPNGLVLLCTQSQIGRTKGFLCITTHTNPLIQTRRSEQTVRLSTLKVRSQRTQLLLKHEYTYILRKGKAKHVVHIRCDRPIKYKQKSK